MIKFIAFEKSLKNSLLFRQEIALNAHISLRPPIDLDRDLEFIERKFGKGTYKKVIKYFIINIL